MIHDTFHSWTCVSASRVLLIATGVGTQDAKHAPKTAKAARRSSQAVVPPVDVPLEPQALEILKAACARLAMTKSMTFTAVLSYENLSRLGTPLIYTTRSEVTVQRPNKLRVLSPGDGSPLEFYYDGKTMMAFEPGANLVAVIEALTTIDAALETAYTSAAMYFPFTNLIVADPYQDVAEGMKLAFYIGQSQVVGGMTTDMVGLANNHVFVQLWIGVEDKLPQMVRAVYKDDPARLRHQMELSNWHLDVAVPADACASTQARCDPYPVCSSGPGAAAGAQAADTG